MTRLMACPHCGHTCKSDGIGAVYCGPHGNGQTYHPAVRMEQIEPEGHAEDAACLDGTCTLPFGTAPRGN